MCFCGANIFVIVLHKFKLTRIEHKPCLDKATWVFSELLDVLEETNLMDVQKVLNVKDDGIVVHYNLQKLLMKALHLPNCGLLYVVVGGDW